MDNNTQTSIARGQIAMGFSQLKAQVANAKRIIEEGRPAVPSGPQQAPAFTPADIAETLGTDAAKYSTACAAFMAAMA